MLKFLIIFSLLFVTILPVHGADASLKKKKKRSHRSRATQSYKPSKHSRKSRRFGHHGTGPDLKSITTESPYKEDPTNGVTPIETKQPIP